MFLIGEVISKIDNSNGPILLVDLCHTLVREDTTRGFVEYALSDKNKIEFGIIKKTLFSIILKVFRIDLFKKSLLSQLKNLTEEKVKELAALYVKETEFNQSVLAIVEEYREKGGQVYVISASLDFVVSAFCEKLGANGYWGSKISLVKGSLRVVEDILYRKEEVIKKALPDANYDVISDNKTDSKLMQGASKSYIVLNRSGQKKYWDKQRIKNIEYIHLFEEAPLG